jgi:hypothetical protein
LQGAGMVPGSRVHAERTPTGFLVNVLGHPMPLLKPTGTPGIDAAGIALHADVARHVFVQAV